MRLQWVSATQTNPKLCGGTQKLPSARSRYSWSEWVYVCSWMGKYGCTAKMGAGASPLQRSMRSFISAGREAENFQECSRQDVHVWGEHCAIMTPDLTVWHWLSPPTSSGSLCLIPVGAHNRPTVYSVHNIKCIELCLFSICNTWFGSSCMRQGSAFRKSGDHKVSGLNLETFSTKRLNFKSTVFLIKRSSHSIHSQLLLKRV